MDFGGSFALVQRLREIVKRGKHCPSKRAWTPRGRLYPRDPEIACVLTRRRLNGRCPWANKRRGSEAMRRGWGQWREHTMGRPSPAFPDMCGGDTRDPGVGRGTGVHNSHGTEGRVYLCLTHTGDIDAGRRCAQSLGRDPKTRETWMACPTDHGSSPRALACAPRPLDDPAPCPGPGPAPSPVSPRWGLGVECMQDPRLRDSDDRQANTT